VPYSRNEATMQANAAQLYSKRSVHRQVDHLSHLVLLCSIHWISLLFRTVYMDQAISIGHNNKSMLNVKITTIRSFKETNIMLLLQCKLWPDLMTGSNLYLSLDVGHDQLEVEQQTTIARTCQAERLSPAQVHYSATPATTRSTNIILCEVSTVRRCCTAQQ